MRRFILSAYDFFSQRRRILFLLTFSIFAFFAFMATRLQFQEDILSFLPKDERSEQISYVYRNVSIADKWVIRIFASSGAEHDPGQLAVYADSLAVYLAANDRDEQIRSIFYRIDNEQFMAVSSFLTEYMPFFLDSADYLRLDTLVQADRIRSILKENHAMLLSPAGSFFRGMYAKDPLHISNLIFARLNELQPGANYPVVDGTLFTRDSLSALMILSSSQNVENTGKNAELVALMDKAEAYISELSGGQAQMNYFSAAAIGVGNADRIKKDSWLSMAISLILIGLLFAAFFRAWRPVCYLMLPVVFGMAIALGAIALLKGYLSAIALGAGSAIVGISLNYSLHFVIHRRVTDTNKEALQDLVSPLTTGSLTTIGAFLSLLFLSAESLRDFGLLATLVLTGTLLFVLFVLPQLSYPSVRRGAFVSKMERMAAYTPETNRPLLWVVAILTLFFAVFMKKAGFNGDLQSINYVTSAQKEAMKQLNEQTEEMNQAHYLVSEGRNMEEALKVHEAGQPLLMSLRDSGAILRVQGIGNWLVSEASQQERARLWADFWRRKGPEVLPVLRAEAASAGFKDSFFAPFLKQAEEGVMSQIPLDYTPLISQLFKDYMIRDSARVMLIDLVYPSDTFEKVWNRHFIDSSSQFLFDKTSVAGQLINALTKDFDFVLYICAFFVFAFLLFSFRSLDLTLLAFLPMMIGWVWILGLMGLFGLQFNIVNVILATFIFGLGDDYSIFIIEGLAYEYAHGKKMLHAYKTAVLLSAMTMFIGMGSLIFARHPAMRSLGEVTVIGMISVVVISYTISPLLFRWMTRYKGRPRVFPVTTASMLRSLFALVIYLMMGLILWLSGFVLLTCLPANKKCKAIYHRQLHGLLRFCANYLFGVKFKMLNPYNETFAEPAIITCNHQSQLDLLYALALTPKMVVITNQWVWNSPFYSRLIRYADFVPVYEGVESSIDMIRDRIEKGYSVLIFPEGHRAGEGEIARFHQGAFYLAESLNVPVVPLVLHGVGNVLPKGSIFLNRGSVCVEIGPRIRPDTSLPLRERTKKLRSWYKVQYADLHARVARPEDYFYMLRQQYAFRGEDILNDFLRRWRATRHFESILKQLPASGTVLFRGSGYGYDALTAAIIRSDLRIDGWEPDEELRQVAVSIGFNPANLCYLEREPEALEGYDRVLDLK